MEDGPSPSSVEPMRIKPHQTVYKPFPLINIKIQYLCIEYTVSACGYPSSFKLSARYAVHRVAGASQLSLSNAGISSLLLQRHAARATRARSGCVRLSNGAALARLSASAGGCHEPHAKR